MHCCRCTPLGGTLADPAIKPAITGLISTGSKTNKLYEFNDRGGIFGGLVVQVFWSHLQPTSSSDLNTTVIDQALDAVSTYNSAVPEQSASASGFGYFPGAATRHDAPDWALSLDGEPVRIMAYYSRPRLQRRVPYYETCMTGHFWDPG